MTAEPRRVTVEITVARPPDVVFEFLADPRNEPRWCPTVSDVRIEGTEWSGTGRYTFVQRFGPLRRRESAEMVESSQPHRLRWRFGAYGSTVESTIDLRAVGTGTHLAQTNDVSCSRLQWLIQRRFAERELPGQLAQLRSILEGA